MDENDIKKIEKLMQKHSSKEILKGAFYIIRPQRKCWISDLVITLISIFGSVIIALSNDTIKLLDNTVNIFNNVVLALFAIVFTGYAFFQALINNELLKRLIHADAKEGVEDKTKAIDDPKSLLQESNEYFIDVMMLDIVEIIINVIQLIFLQCLPIRLPFNVSLIIANILKITYMSVYFAFSLSVIWEMKSFIFNTFQLFNAHASAKALEILENEGDKNNGNSDK